MASIFLCAASLLGASHSFVVVKERSNKQVRTERGVLPVEHPQRTDAVLAGVVAAVERDDMLTAAASLSDFMDEEALQVAEVRPPSCTPSRWFVCHRGRGVTASWPGCLPHAHWLVSCMTFMSLRPGRPRCAATLHGRDAGRGILSGLHVLAAPR